jgi:hypothetical protein
MWMTANEGARAEHLVHDRLRAALPEAYRLFATVRWLSRERGLARDGEADLVIAHPEHGLLVLEVKAGDIRRDGEGTWWAGPNRLKRSPFEQAADSRHALVRKLAELPGWEAGLKPIAGHAVAFPDVDLRSAGPRIGLLGPDVDADLILDQPRLLEGSTAEARAWVDRAFAMWAGGADTRAPGEQGIGLLEDLLTEPVELRSLLRNEIAAGGRDLVRMTPGQLHVLTTLRHVRRAEVVGGAGTGKTLLAAEKARRLAREGFRTLLVCFNSPLARMLADDTADVARDTRLLDVSTFHQLCEDLAGDADTLPAKPYPVPASWFSHALPRALDAAIDEIGPRFHAIVVDEGQDFDAEWLVSLEALLFEPKEDVLYVFHDPAQAIYRDDAVAQLGLTRYELDLNCRNAQPIHALVARFADGGLAAQALREDGRAPELIGAETDDEVVEALRVVLHRLRAPDGEGVPPWDIAVLVGRSLEDSAVWRQRRFGNEVLWNGQVDEAGHPLGLSAGDVPAQPSDSILCDSIRRFKGLERPVVILAELRPDHALLERLLYIGASRATQHLVVVAPVAVLDRMRP